MKGVSLAIVIAIIGTGILAWVNAQMLKKQKRNKHHATKRSFHRFKKH